MIPRSKKPNGLHALLLVALFLTFAFSSWADETNQAPLKQVVPPSAPGDNQPDLGKIKAPVDTTESDTKPDPKRKPIKPMTVNAERDYEISHIVADLLERGHYLGKQIDPEMSQRWLSNYFLALDPNHLFFLQSDVDDFTAKYGGDLGERLLHGESEEAAVAPAFEIFQRYMQRVSENVAQVKSLLQAKYDFTKDESFTAHTDKSHWLPDAAASQTFWQGQVKSDLLNGLLDKKAPAVTIKRLTKRYDSLLRTGQEMEEMDVLEAYLSALTHAYDPHSDYYDPDEFQNFTIGAINHSVTGIGAVLRSDDGYATIEEVIAGGPADLNKRLQPGDRIVAVGEGTKEPVDVVNMNLNHVVDKIRGPKGSIVHLVVLPAGSADDALHKDIVIKRDEVSIKDSLAKARIIQHPIAGGQTEKIGVIELHDFYDNLEKHFSASTDVAKLIQRLKKERVAGIILDVRSNGGGLLEQAVDLTGLFVKHEPVVQIRRSDGIVNHLDTEGASQIYNGPLMVMVNKASASATEIVAGALQDYGRAIIVGDQSTHGKGTVQTLISLDERKPIGFFGDPGGLKMTIQKFYRVAGGSTQQKGVVPDIVLPSVLDALELGETTLPYYLPYDTVSPANFEYLNLAAPYLPALRTNSIARVAASPDFAYVRHDVDYYKKKVTDPTVSLNMAVRQKQTDDLKTLNAQRKKDLEARKSGRDPVLELTLDMVDQNLPPAPPQDKKKPKIASDNDSEDDLDASLASLKVDPQLDEAVNIMCDYDQMLRDVSSKLVQTVPTPTK